MEIAKIDKVELHQHLELSLRPSTIKELAPSFGIEVPDEAAYREKFVITEPMNDLGAVLNKFLDTQKLLGSEEILERISFEACEDAYNQGVRILELRYAPTFVADGHPNLNFETIHQAIVKGIKRAEATYPMAVGLICIIQRILPVEKAEEVTQFAIDNRETFLGLDLADNEEGFDSKPFSPFFHKAIGAGLKITVHAAEINTGKSPTYIVDAVEHLGAHRIGHGVQIHRDPAMIKYAIEKNLVLELCPTSNYLTKAVLGTVADHPFRKLFDAGVKTTINTDDPGIFDTNIIKEYEVLQKYHGFTLDEFNQCNDWAAAASFIDAEKKQKVWPRPILPL